MPGRSPNEAVEAFLGPLQTAMACVGPAHFTLSPGSRSLVGETHSWRLNDDGVAKVGGGLQLAGQMHFEIQDLGQSQAAKRFKVSTRAYRYAILDGAGAELLCAHWHPTGHSPHTYPHWHLGSVALAPSGVFLKRAHIPSPRVTFESVIRMLLDFDGVKPAVVDWETRLESSEATFEQYKSW